MSSEIFAVAGMLAAASAETGLNDFGDGEFREALTRLVDSTNKEIALSAMGAMAFKGEVHRTLVNRLRFAADLKRHPEILNEQIDDPIIITGLPRTGSTKLQRMMAADPESHSLKFWQMMNPAPFPDAVTGIEDPRIETGRQTLEIMNQLAPGFGQSHPTQFDDVDEEVFLQMFTFKCMLTYLSHPAPAYFDWLMTQSLRGTYRYMKQMLQYIQWQNGGWQQRPWIMKSPVHVANLDLLLELFPNATIVVTHRDLNKVLPSFCRLMGHSWKIKTDNVDPLVLGQMSLTLWSGELKKHLQQRQSLGSKIQLMDVSYDDVKNNAIGAIARIYNLAGRELTPSRRQAMLAWEAKNPQHQQGGYSYKLEDYGLTREAISTAFSEYQQRFSR